MKDFCFPELFLKHLLETNPGQFLNVGFLGFFKFVWVSSCFPLKKKCLYVFGGLDLKI